MTLFLKFLYILAILLLGLVLLLLAFTIPRAGVGIYSKDEEIKVWLRYGWLRIQLFPLPAWTMPRTKSAKKPTDKPAKKRRKALYDFSSFDMGGAVYLLLEVLEELREALHLEAIRIKVMLGTGNAAKTGLLLGSAAAITGMLTPFLVQNFNIRDYQISVDGDFEAERTHWEATLAFALRPIRLLWALIWRWRRIKNLYNSIEKMEAKSHE